MNLEDFDYFLPESLIAKEPTLRRDASRLLVYNSNLKRITHTSFSKIADFLPVKTALVFNNSKVVPARLNFKVKDKDFEILLLKRFSDPLKGNSFLAMVNPGKKFKTGVVFAVADDLFAEVLFVRDDGLRELSFKGNLERVNELARIPFPPYIPYRENLVDRYQTVYAKHAGSVAAPTAGLHFTEELLRELRFRGYKQFELTLHVGLGTFMPVKVEKIVDHVMHSEFFHLEDTVAEDLNALKAENWNLCAVGSTTARVLETCAVRKNFLKSFSGETNIFIYPGFSWRFVDFMVTNFHLPKSTLLMMVTSFLESKGLENPLSELKRIYSVAIEEKYRFFSFGDAMLIL